MTDFPLDSISVEGWKSLGALSELPLRQVNILVGANGSGKSNFIGVFSLLHAIREGRLQDFVRRSGGAGPLLHFGSGTTDSIKVHISFGGGVNQYRINLLATEDDTLVPSLEIVYFRGAGYTKPFTSGLSARERNTEAGISDPQLQGIGSFVRQKLDLWRVYHACTTPARIHRCGRQPKWLTIIF